MKPEEPSGGLNFATFKEPSILEKIRSLRRSGYHGNVPPAPSGFPGAIVVHLGARISFRDRLRILFGGDPEFRLTMGFAAPQEQIDQHTVIQNSFVVK